MTTKLRAAIERLGGNRDLTIGECYGPAGELVKTRKEAQAYMEALVGHSIRVHGQTEKEARRLQRSNIGYYSGYYSAATMVRAQRLFSAVHPIFGSAIPSPQEAYDAGKKLAR